MKNVFGISPNVLVSALKNRAGPDAKILANMIERAPATMARNKAIVAQMERDNATSKPKGRQATKNATPISTTERKAKFEKLVRGQTASAPYKTSDSVRQQKLAELVGPKAKQAPKSNRNSTAEREKKFSELV